MSLERLLQICVAALAAIGTLLFGVGQQSVTLPVLSVSAAATSVYVTDVHGWIRLNRGVANLAALLAVSLAVVDFFNYENSSQLLALANLLVYLQVILLFQRKDERIYWQLLMLSLLQVMVATALNFGVLFGVLLVVYLLIALITLSLFLILREAARVRGDNALSTQALSGRGLAGQGELAIAPGGVQRERRERGPFQVEHDVHELPSSELLPAIATSAVSQSLLTLGLTALLFFMIPRTGQEQLVLANRTGQRMVGFSDSVELGELGHAYQNDEDVMRVRFQGSQGEPLTVASVPMFRGTVLDTYLSHLESSDYPRRSRWVFDDSSSERSAPLDAIHLNSEDRVHQETVLEPMQKEKTVFQVYPVLVAKNDPHVEIDAKRHHLRRRGSSKRKLTFTLETAGFRRDGGRITQHEINPALSRLSNKSEERLTKIPSGEDDLFPQLRAEAARVLADAQLSPADSPADQSALDQSNRAARAWAMERYFLTDPRFGYSLEGQPRDPDLDPIEDFIANRPQGHCEYYASALALMLRSQNIPARIVVGFKGGRWNSYGKFFQVEQLNAHSWVEVYLRPEQVPQRYWRPTMRDGAWLRLDPTPGAGDTLGEAASLTILDRVWELTDYSQYLWGSYVVGLDSRRQRELIYQPLAGLADHVKFFFSKEMWQETVPEFFTSLTRASTWGALLEYLLTLRGAFATILTLLLVYYVGRRLRRRTLRFGLRRRRRGSAATSPDGRSYPVIDFYQQFEKLLARHGLSRSENQTQHEFAVTVGGEFRSRASLREVAPLPKTLVDAFYRVRFGGHTLDKQQTEAVEQSLGQLAVALASAGADHRQQSSAG